MALLRLQTCDVIVVGAGILADLALTGATSAPIGFLASGARVALLQQDVPQDVAGPVRDIVAAGLPPAPAETAWQHDEAVAQILGRMNLDGGADFAALSAGMKRRVLLARAVVSQPDLLLLDEPTNHLDIEAVEWLETFLGRWQGTLMFVTHDRTFLRRMADRILEIDRGRIFDWSCDYDTFLLRKEEALAAEEKAHALFDTRLAQEEAWIRTGIKARRTRNEGRVRALEALRRERSGWAPTCGSPSSTSSATSWTTRKRWPTTSPTATTRCRSAASPGT